MPHGTRKSPASQLTNDVQQQLDNLATLLRQIEAECLQVELTTRNSVLARHRAAMLDTMHALGNEVNAFLASAPSETEIQAVKERVTTPIRAWSATGSFFHHSYTKPRGYPGDFETIEIIYDCFPRGDILATDSAQALPGLIFDDCYLHGRPAQAVRNRLGYLVDRLGAEVQRRVASGLSPVRLLSLGSGPARELALLAQRPSFAESVEVTCLDMDSAALAYARQHINGHLNGQVKFVRDNALRYASGANRPALPFHVIYAAGLFDYLNADVSARLIEDCHGLLAPGGTLIVGNFSLETHPNDRVLIEWLFDWRLLYRNEADYRSIFARTSFDKDALAFEHEPLRANLFAVAHRL